MMMSTAKTNEKKTKTKITHHNTKKNLRKNHTPNEVNTNTQRAHRKAEAREEEEEQKDDEEESSNNNEKKNRNEYTHISR